MLGKTLSHYTLQDKLGAGGMGVVYIARDERLGRDVALKLLPQASLADDASRARFRREAMALSRLNHPNIATVHDFDSQDGFDFLVMELVEGETLAEKLGRGAVTEAEAIALGLQIAEALEDAHERGVVHRDLKPSNIMVGPKGRVKVLDFGLARLLKSEDVVETVSVSAAGTWSGTLPYMPPEQLDGDKVDGRSDLYALGAILYELATGRRAFPATNAAKLLNAVLNETPQAPSALREGISGAFDAAVLRALEKDPARRPSCAKDLIQELKQVVSGPASGASAKSFTRALELNEGDGYIHLFHMNYLDAMGRYAEAERTMTRALELDPLSMIINTAVGWVHYHADQFEKASASLKRAVDMFPEFVPARIWYSIALEQLGELKEALGQAERARTLGGRTPLALAALGRALARLGRVEEAENVLREMRELGERRYVSPYETAVVSEALGRPSEALDDLERAYRGRANFLALLRVDPRLKSLRGNPRFQDLERRMAFPQPLPAAR